MSAELWTPSKAAIRLTQILRTFADATNAPRFPIDVTALAFEAFNFFHWTDRISEVKAAPIRGFEGALAANEDRSEWMLLYNDRLTSPGRIRFTQAHELGHYCLHRSLSERFECTEADMIHWDGVRDIEMEADSFAGQLLMPLDDYRAQVGSGDATLDALSACAERYGVSMTAAVHRWLEFTEESALLIVSREGFIDYAKSSKRAMKAGAFFKTKGRPPVPIPDQSLAANPNVVHDRDGQPLSSLVWFPNSQEDFVMREMKLTSDRYDSTFTLLRLPRSAKVWPEWGGDVA